MAGEGISLGTAYGYIELDTSGVDRAIKSAQQSFSGGIQSIGSSISGFGASLSTVFTPISLALGKATKDSMEYSEALVNIQAVTGMTADETQVLSDQLLEIGQHSRAGPQAVAESFYDIAGGVVDASSRMAVLNAAIAASEAGNADLGGTTKALISIMNGYGFSAEEAGHASDVLTQIVAKGVGSMDEMASALPTVAGQAHDLGISFDDLGAMTSYITTKGVAAGQATTQLGALMSAMAQPSTELSAALKSIGFESGRAAVKQLGLVGTLDKLKDAGYNVDDLVGRIEGARGAISLTDDTAKSFLENFNDGMDGLTEKARQIQDASPAAQLDFFNSAMSTLSITIGDTLAPVLSRMLEQILPIIQSVIDWVRANPELVSQIGMIAGALGIVGPILIGVGAAISAIGAIAGSALLPIIAIVAGVYLAFKNNFGGIRDFLQPILDRIGLAFQLAGLAFGDFQDTIDQGGSFIEAAIATIAGVISNFLIGLGILAPEQFVAFQDGIETTLGNVVTFITGTVIPALTTLADWFLNDALPAIVTFVTGTVIPAIGAFFTFLGNAWAVIGPALFAIADWFITTALPAIVNFVTTVVIPGIQSLISTLIGIWTQIQPGLQALFDWFVTTALPAIVNFIQTVVIPGVQGFIDLLVNIWTQIQPGLQALWDWFTVTALPAIIAFVQTTVIPGVQGFIDLLLGIWTQIQPGLQSLWDWFTVTALPGVVNFVQNTVMPAVQGFVDLLVGIWTAIQPGLSSFFDWVTKTGLPAIQSALQWFNDNIVKPISDALGGLFSGISNISSGVSGAVNSLTGPGTFLGGIGTTISQAVAIGQSVLGHDYPGAYSNNAAYMVGTGAQPEAFIPSSGGGGMAIPNFDKVMAGLMGGGQNGVTFEAGSVVVNANSAAEGRAAAISFEAELRQRLAARGN